MLSLITFWLSLWNTGKHAASTVCIKFHPHIQQSTLATLCQKDSVVYHTNKSTEEARILQHVNISNPHTALSGQQATRNTSREPASQSVSMLLGETLQCFFSITFMSLRCCQYGKFHCQTSEWRSSGTSPDQPTESRIFRLV